MSHSWSCQCKGQTMSSSGESREGKGCAQQIKFISAFCKKWLSTESEVNVILWWILFDAAMFLDYGMSELINRIKGVVWLVKGWVEGKKIWDVNSG
jgi:hypothetical protein